ncbi:SnoaL-like domain protein [Pirellulimonas nuda]|uniref:SnoaL-like domain protein n=1 Tax=Pirellulimonas nuda TaxID=2528009 RepID=A0A518DC67_9BACT|nr:nuclear transport factor 2 family protein [Pirellulimonas nuda]QDU89026.1 SnoaL-like domain protein [Pirellulimonas nuda]
MKAVALLAVWTAVACTTARGADSGPESSDDAASIRQRVDAYVAAYNRHDAAALAGCWAEDAVYLNRETGQPVEGRPAIREMFAGMFESGEASRLSVTIDSIRLVTPDVAIEDGTAEIVTADGGVVGSTYTAIHAKKNGEWFLNSVRETDAPGASAEPNELNQLAWLVGEWADEAEDATTRSRWQWAKNGHFLTNNFSVSVADRVELEGTQVVGWDPVARQIRSWVFDSEGGYAEGVWRRAGERWMVKTRSTLSDGSRASATSIYAPVDESAFTWSSIDRQIDGEPQADIQEISVHRQSTDASAEVLQELSSEGK